MVTRKRPTARAKAAPKDPVSEIVRAIRDEIGEDGAMVLGDDRMAFKIKGVVSFGCLAIDRAIGRGGAPLGRLTILHGGEGSGKTTAALHICAQAQKAGGIAVYVDKEYKLDPDWAAAIGVDTKNLVMSQPKHLEAAIKLMKGVIKWASKVRTQQKKNYPIVLVLDSINACVSKVVYESDEEDAHVAPEARVWSKHLPKLIEDAARENVSLVFVSQVRKKINVMFGDDANLAGGEAPKFFASCIGFFKRVGSVKVDGERVANKVECEWKKNQISPPFRKARFLIRFKGGAGFDSAMSIIDVAESMKIVVKKGSTLLFKGKRLGVGYENARKKLVRNPDLAEEILALIKAHDSAEADGKELIDPEAAAPDPDDEAELDAEGDESDDDDDDEDDD